MDLNMNFSDFMKEYFKEEERQQTQLALDEGLETLFKKRKRRARFYRSSKRVSDFIERKRQAQLQKIQIDNLREVYPDNDFALYSWLADNQNVLQGRNVRIYAQYIDENGNLRERSKAIQNFAMRDVHNGDFTFRRISEEEYPFFRVVVIIGGNTNILITNVKNILNQTFRIGISNCLLTPIKNRFLGDLKSSTSKKYKKAIQLKIKKVERLQKKYLKGVPRDCIQHVCNELKVTIYIIQPILDEQIILVKPSDNIRSTSTFRYWNTRPGHVECVSGDGLCLAHDDTTITLTDELIEKKYKKIKNSGKWYLIQRYKGRINYLSTLTDSYKTKSELGEQFNDFCAINDISTNLHHQRDPLISNFLEDGDIANISITFNHNIIKEFNHIDMEKAYSQNKYFRSYSKDGDILSQEANPYYMGFLKRIYEFRKTNKEIGVGVYQIKKLVIGEKLNALNKKMKIYDTSCWTMILSSPELQFLRDNGATFEIVAGAWGQVGDIDFNKSTLQKYNGTPLYSLYVGLLHCGKGKKEVIVKSYDGLRDLIKAQDISGKAEIGTIDEVDKEVRIRFLQDGGNHAIQIPIFVQAYQRIRLLQQLLEMDITKIISVITDGIYYEPHTFKMLAPFRFQQKDKIIRNDRRTFINASIPKSYYKNEKLREPINDGNYKTEYWGGSGGTGKTFTACHNSDGGKNFIKLAYCAPSNKLKKMKKNEFNNLHAYTIDHIVGNSGGKTRDESKINMITRNYNCLLVDEVSMMTDIRKNLIIELYPNHKIIFAGDVGYQLAPMAPKKIKYVKLKEFDMHTNIEHIETFTKSYRFIEGDYINVVLQDLRKRIKNKQKSITLDTTHFNVLSRDEFLKGDYYRPTDLIISYMHVQKDLYTKHFKHKYNKWIITKKNKKNEVGEILYNETKPTGSEARHGFTCHSIQGETTSNNLFIDMTRMESNLRCLYTALSRVRRISQIYLIYA